MGLHAVGETGAGVVAGRALLGAEELRESFSALAGVRYQMPDYALNPSADGGRTLDMTMRAVPRFEVSCGYFGEKKAGEEVTGDALSCFGNRGDYFHVLLCDGMGSGREASVTSQLCTLFLEKLLSVCSAHGAALNLLNGFLRSRQGECAASVDLCGIDVLTGDAEGMNDIGHGTNVCDRTEMRTGAAREFVFQAEAYSANVVTLQKK